MAPVFGLIAALTYGGADFVGGLMSKRTESFVVVFFSQLTAAPLIAVVPLFGGAPTQAAWLWGGIAGLAGGGGVVFLYRGLARGRMSVVAPITAVEAASLPVVAGALSGEIPGRLALLGVLLALPAVALVSTSRDEAAPASARDAKGGGVIGALRGPIGDALIAGICFGVFFIALDLTGDDTGMWPLVPARISALLLVGSLLLVRGRGFERGDASLKGIALAGCLDVTANVFYILSARGGLLAVAAVLTSMYPAGTVLLARIVLKESLLRVQLVGLALAAVAVALIALG